MMCIVMHLTPFWNWILIFRFIVYFITLCLFLEFTRTMKTVKWNVSDGWTSLLIPLYVDGFLLVEESTQLQGNYINNYRFTSAYFCARKMEHKWQSRHFFLTMIIIFLTCNSVDFTYARFIRPCACSTCYCLSTHPQSHLHIFHPHHICICYRIFFYCTCMQCTASSSSFCWLRPLTKSTNH